MNLENFWTSKLFRALYRAVLPSCFLVLFIILPWINTRNQNFTWIDWVLHLAVTVALYLIYGTVTHLGDIPSKHASRLGLWPRYGGFNGDRFVPFFDRSILRPMFFINAFGVSAVVSIALREMFLIDHLFSETISTVLAAINFFLLLVPIAFQYQVFEEAIFHSDSPEQKV